MTSYSTWEPRSWIVPPGLLETLMRFEIRCNAILDKKKAGKHSCLLIRGETGVGKSMFAEFFIHKYLKQFPEKKVFFLNCSAIPATLLESELFGYKKGSATGAFKDKKGIFDLAGDGVIVLEELGEMKKEIQAKLLVAIENRVYFALGDSKETKLNAQIIATSNVTKNKFRTDFWYRFETFKIPPLHERRYDVLYYINHFDPEIFKLLNGGVVLALFAYNWPGNVREVEMVCNVIRENIQYAKKNKFMKEDSLGFTVNVQHRLQYGALFRKDTDVSSFRFNKGLELAMNMKAKNIKIKFIEEVLGEHSLSFDCYSPEFNMTLLAQLNKTDEYNLSYIGDKIMIVENKIFLHLYLGFVVFCFIFSQDYNSNLDILDLTSPLSWEKPGEAGTTMDFIKLFLDANVVAENSAEKSQDHTNYINFINLIFENQFQFLSVFEFLPKKMKTVVLECTKYLTGISNLCNDDLINLQDFYNRNKSNAFLSKYFGEEAQVGGEEIHIENISLDELRDLYYETLCSVLGTAHGYQKKIAKISGRTEGRVSQVLDKIGLTEKFRKLNYTPRKRLVILK